jgi:hypothetical protein
MVKPTKPTAPAQALRSNPDTFPARAEENIAFAFGTLPTYIDAAMTYAEAQVEAANTAALAAGGGSGLDFAGNEGGFLRINAAGNGLEFLGFTAAGLALLDDTTAAAQRLTLGAAPLASPPFTGIPTAPTAAVGVSTTQLATTAFVAAAAGEYLLGTLTTTSGTTQTLSGLNLTAYSTLRIVVKEVSFTATATLTLGGSGYDIALETTSANKLFGQSVIDLATGIAASALGVISDFAGPFKVGTVSPRVTMTGVVNASTSLSFGGGTFDAGTIYVYGVK